jgi:hypothetical protein
MASSESSQSSKPQSKDTTWDHGFLPDLIIISKIQYKYCPKVIQGVTPLKYHIVGIPKEVSACDKVLPEVRKKIHDILMTKK